MNEKKKYNELKKFFYLVRAYINENDPEEVLRIFQEIENTIPEISKWIND